MKININNYVVFIISSPHDAEKFFINTITHTTFQDFCYAAIGPKCKEKIISKPGDNSTNNHNQYSLYLINGECWKCPTTNHNCSCNEGSNPSKKIKSLIESIKSDNKNIIVWIHSGDRIANNEIKELFGDKCDFFAFSHTTPPHKVEVLMMKICHNNDNDFENSFSGFIEYSLQKKTNPHLIALSILCQGYLAAHNWEFKAENDDFKKEKEAWAKVQQKIKDTAAAKKNDEDPKRNPTKKPWWADVVDKTEICRELESITNTKERGKGTRINDLITNIFDNGVAVEAEKVVSAHIDLKPILKGIIRG